MTKITELLTQRILFLDGAMGTMIQRHKLDEGDYRGERFADWPSDLKGNNDLLVLTQPEIIRDIHAQYLEAGADIIETNTFNATLVAMADYGMEALVPEINRAAAELARQAADAATAATPTPWSRAAWTSFSSRPSSTPSTPRRPCSPSSSTSTAPGHACR